MCCKVLRSLSSSAQLLEKTVREAGSWCWLRLACGVAEDKREKPGREWEWQFQALKCCTTVNSMHKGLFRKGLTYMVQNKVDIYWLDSAEMMRHRKLPLQLAVQLLWCWRQRLRPVKNVHFSLHWITSQAVCESNAPPQILSNCMLSVQFLLHCVTQRCDDDERKVFTVCSVNSDSCCYLTFGKKAAFQYGLLISSLILHPNVTTTILPNWQQCLSFCSSAGAQQ